VILFGSTGPILFLAAVFAAWADVPRATDSLPESKTFAEVRTAILIGLRQYLGNKLILTALFGFLLTYGGTTVLNNLSIFAKEATGETAESYAGLQLALRFGFKSIAGFALGMLVARIHAKASLLVTTAVCLAGVAWAIVVPGRLYLLSFGLLGAGELFYVYYLNFIVGCSAPTRIRENTAYTNLVSAAVGAMALVFGVIADEFGLRSSFMVAITMFAMALVVVGWLLPREPLAGPV